jgi:hypothetical protein
MYLVNLIRKLCGFRKSTNRSQWTQAPGTRKPRKARLMLEQLETRLVPTGLNYGTGPLLSNVEATAVFDGPAWSTNSSYVTEARQLGTFLNQIVNSPYMDQLSEYSGNGQTIGRGSFSGSDVSPGGWTTQSQLINGTIYPAVITDANITAMLNQEIANGNVPAPDANRVYVVYVNPNTVVTNASINQDSVPQTTGGKFFTAYHQSATDANGDTYYYAVIVDPTGDAGTPIGAPSGITTLQYETISTSHELAEAVTDPDLSTGWRDTTTPKTGATYQAEIGDYTQNTVPAGTATATLDGFTVQKEWSNALNTSLAPPSDAVKYVLGQRVPTAANGYQGDYGMALTAGGQVQSFFYGGTRWVSTTGSNTVASDLYVVGSNVYMLAANSPGADQVWVTTGAADGWTPITGTNTHVTQLVVADGNLYLLGHNPGASGDQVYKYSGNSNDWGNPISDTATQIAVAYDETLFMLGTNGQVQWYSPSNSAWSSTPALPGGFSTVTSIAATANDNLDGSLYVLARNPSSWQGQVMKLTGDWTWQDVTGTNTHVSQIAAAGNALYMLANNGGANQVWEYSGSGTDWGQPITGGTNVSNIVAAGDGLYMLGDNGLGNQVWKYNGFGQNWTPVSPSGWKLGTLWVYGQQLRMGATPPGGTGGTYQYAGTPSNWTQLP